MNRMYNDEIDKEKSAHKSDNKRNRDRISELEDELSEVRRKKAEASKKSSDERQKMQDEIMNLKQQLADAQKSNRSKDSEIKDLNNKNAAISEKYNLIAERNATAVLSAANIMINLIEDGIIDIIEFIRGNNSNKEFPVSELHNNLQNGINKLLTAYNKVDDDKHIMVLLNSTKEKLITELTKIIDLLKNHYIPNFEGRKAKVEEIISSNEKNNNESMKSIKSAYMELINYSNSTIKYLSMISAIFAKAEVISN